MLSLILIPLCFLAGRLCRRLERFPPSTAHALNAFVLSISLPALVLSRFAPFLRELTLDRSLWIPVSMAWIAFLLAWAIFRWVGSRLGWARGTIGAVVLTAGLGNTSFIGFPLLEALMGPRAVQVGILVDQPGSFLVLGTAGILAAAMFSGKKVSLRDIAGRVFGFPPFLALCLSIIWAALGVPGSSVVLPVLEQLSQTLVPLALFSVGFQLSLNLREIQKRASPLAYALLFKLALTPLFFLALYFGLLRDRGFESQVTVLESAMAPMITSAVVAGEFDLDPELANRVVSLGIILSFVTVPVWHILIERLL